MEIIVLLVVAGAVALLWWYNRGTTKFDVNNDGKVDSQDVKVAVETVKAGIAADIVKVKTAAKKATPKKPAAKKPAAKKPAVKKPVKK